MNANDIPHIDFTQPWYSTDVVEQLTYEENDVTFIFIGACDISSMSMTGCNSYYQKRKSNWENYMASVYAKFDGYEG